MDKFGQGMEIEYKDIIKSKELNFSNFTDDMLLEMCVLSGCDYLSSLPGLGVKKAHNLVRRLKSYRKVCGSHQYECRVLWLAILAVRLSSLFAQIKLGIDFYGCLSVT